MELDTYYFQQSPGILSAEINKIFDDYLRENTVCALTFSR